MKGKVYKYSLKVIFVVFTVFAFIFFALSVDGFRGVNVYRCAAAGHYGDGLDGKWETSVFIIELFANMFSKIDLVITPCAFMAVMASFGACFALAWLIVLFAKHKSAVLKAEVGLLIFYALFAIADIILICGLKFVYNSFVGAAPIALLVLTLVCLVSSAVVYVFRKKYFQEQKDLASELQITLD